MCILALIRHRGGTRPHKCVTSPRAPAPPPPRPFLPGHRELSANIFVRSLTTDKIENEDIRGAQDIADAHYKVGSETRDLITRSSGTKPEDLPAEPSIRPLLDQQSRRRKRITEAQQPSLLDGATGEE